MSATMQPSVLIKVLSKFDKNGEVKMNKMASSYNSTGGYDAYHWTFNGPIKGTETRLKLVRLSATKYNLMHTVTKTIEEVIEVSL